VIQSILFFALGFLCAGFVALMVGPAIWRRAVRLTRRRIEATVPLTLEEIQADKDRMRAEFAVSTRRLEMSIQALREKNAKQLIELNRARDEMKHLAKTQAEHDAVLGGRDSETAKLKAELARRDEEAQRLARSLEEAERSLEIRSADLDKLGQMYDEASFSASNRQIELVAKESELERLAEEAGQLKNQRREAEKRGRAFAAQNKTLQEALRAERAKLAAHEQRLEQLSTELTEKDERLERREKELALARGQLKGRAGGDLEMQLAEAQAERVKLEAELAETNARLQDLLAGESLDDDAAMLAIEGGAAPATGRMRVLLRENQALKQELLAARAAGAANGTGGDEALRDHIQGLAAEVISLTAKLDGPDSPIHAALGEGRAGEAGGDRLTSLAERVRALQASAGEAAARRTPEPVQGDR
jgi:DNA repair exonuclease SbcCD ATPase subunit